jgi:hypothetical protein
LETLAARWKGRVELSAFIRTLADDFRLYGRQAIEKVRKTQPAAYMKICALLVPREMKVEHSGGVKDLTDEQLKAANRGHSREPCG